MFSTAARVDLRKSSSAPSMPIAQATPQAIAQATAHMRKSSSTPSVLHATRRRGSSPAILFPTAPREPALRGGVLLRGAPGAGKAMSVDFEASPGTLWIVLKQERDGVVHDFVLFTLDLVTLFVGWDSRNQDLFVMGAQHRDRVFHPIYCYPCRFRRNRWLRFFEDNGCALTSMVRVSACENDHFRVLSRIGESFTSA